MTGDMEMSEHIEAMDAYEDQYHGQPDPECEPERCPACGQFTDYCAGHGPLGDPDGFIALSKHDNDDHSECHDMAECRIGDSEW